MDALLEVLVFGIRMLLHIEFQTYHDKDMLVNALPSEQVWPFNGLFTGFGVPGQNVS